MLGKVNFYQGPVVSIGNLKAYVSAVAGVIILALGSLARILLLYTQTLTNDREIKFTPQDLNSNFYTYGSYTLQAEMPVLWPENSVGHISKHQVIINMQCKCPHSAPHCLIIPSAYADILGLIARCTPRHALPQPHNSSIPLSLCSVGRERAGHISKDSQKARAMWMGNVR